eukprot:956339-Prymnesium_polylepis.1
MPLWRGLSSRRWRCACAMGTTSCSSGALSGDAWASRWAASPRATPPHRESGRRRKHGSGCAGCAPMRTPQRAAAQPTRAAVRCGDDGSELVHLNRRAIASVLWGGRAGTTHGLAGGGATK